MDTQSFELTPEQKGLLETLSRETGKPVPVLIAEALEKLGAQERLEPVHRDVNGDSAEDAEESSVQDEDDDKPIWESFIEASLEIPDEELDRLPTDGATQHDHYIYGTPKRPV